MSTQKRHQRQLADKTTLTLDTLRRNIPAPRCNLLTKKAGAGSFQHATHSETELSSYDVIRIGLAARTFALLDAGVAIARNRPPIVIKNEDGTKRVSDKVKIRDTDAILACDKCQSKIYFDENAADKLADKKRADKIAEKTTKSILHKRLAASATMRVESKEQETTPAVSPVATAPTKKKNKTVATASTTKQLQEGASAPAVSSSASSQSEKEEADDDSSRARVDDDVDGGEHVVASLLAPSKKRKVAESEQPAAAAAATGTGAGAKKHKESHSHGDTTESKESASTSGLMNRLFG
jgi:hypothetical protein